METNEFKCAICGDVFEEGRSQEDAEKEFEENFGVKMDHSNVDIVCSDCYVKMKGLGIFLKYKLLTLGRETEMDIQSLSVCLSKMFNECMSEITDSIDDESTPEDETEVLKRIFNVWENVSGILRKEGRPFMARKGLVKVLAIRKSGINPELN